MPVFGASPFSVQSAPRVRMRCVAFPDKVLSDRVRGGTKLSRDGFVEFAYPLPNSEREA
jgi:hypothetical protein